MKYTETNDNGNRTREYEFCARYASRDDRDASRHQLGGSTAKHHVTLQQS